MKLNQLHVGSGHQVGPLTLFPVWCEGPAVVSLTTGATANLSVTELPGGPQVGKLLVTNRNTKPALLLEGELLEGGHQHRVCARDVILAPGETREVDTLCVEQGRWGGASSHGHSGRRAPLNVRAELNRTHSGGPVQQRVWSRVGRFQGMNTVSATGSLVEHLEASAGRVFGATALPKPIDGQRGVVVGFGGKALMIELFGSHRLFVQHYRALVEAAMLDIQLTASSLPHVLTPAQSARDLAVRVMELGLSRDGGPVSVNGVTYKTPGHEPVLAHLTGWDARHPIMAG